MTATFEKFTLPDGRSLDYIVSGAKDGFPIIALHGTPGAGLTSSSFLRACETNGLKCISISRPGYGDSTRQKGRGVIHVVKDLQALNEHLGVKSCYAVGWSGGGPHVLACAARLPGCIAVLCVVGVAPYEAEGLDFLAGQGEGNVEEWQATLQGEEALQKFLEPKRPQLINADAAGLIKSMESNLPEVDKQTLLHHPEVAQGTIDRFKEGLKHGNDGWADDDLAFVRPWGFELNEIKVPVLLYAGSEDKMVPFSHAQWLAEHLPQDVVKSYLQQGHGHISISVGQTDAMVEKLLAAAKR